MNDVVVPGAYVSSPRVTATTTSAKGKKPHGKKMRAEILLAVLMLWMRTADSQSCTQAFANGASPDVHLFLSSSTLSTLSSLEFFHLRLWLLIFHCQSTLTLTLKESAQL